MKIVRYPIDEIADNIAESFSQQSFFSSKNFMQLWQSIGGNPVYWTVEENDTIIGLLPGVEFGVSKLKRFQSMPDGCYAKFLLSNNIKQDASNALLDAIGDFGYIKTYIYDYFKSFTKYEKFDTFHCSTSVVDISDPNWEPPDKKLQSEIRKAERENVTIETFDSSVHFDKFLSLMKQTEKRHNRKPKYQDVFFEKLAELAQTDNRIKWYWCEHDGDAVCSHINFIENNMVVNWQVYYDKKYSFLKANQKSLFDMAKSLSAQNITYLNLGASPIDTESLKEYKEKWGGKEYKYTCLSKESIIGKIV